MLRSNSPNPLHNIRIHDEKILTDDDPQRKKKVHRIFFCDRILFCCSYFPPRLQRNRYGIALLVLLWCLLVFYSEIAVFHWKMNQCARSVQQRARDVRTVILADPQLSDERSYSYAPSGSSILKVVEYFSDAYMRKNFQLLQVYLRPRTAFNVGDLMDGGRYLQDNTFADELERFNYVFERRFYESDGEPEMKVYNLSGNHDISWGLAAKKFQARVIERFQRHFGPVNYRVSLNGWEWVGLSSLTLSQHTADQNAVQRTMDFLKNLGPPTEPRILLSHVPLWRSAITKCGKYRSNPVPVKEGKGFDYVNTLSYAQSNLLLSRVHPKFIFSGDDHDWCNVTHEIPTERVIEGHVPQSVTEITLGTFSWTQGNFWPSFLVVTPGAKDQLFIDLCFLPSQILLYMAYLLALVATIFTFSIILVWETFFVKTAVKERKFARDIKNIFTEILAVLALIALFAVPLYAVSHFYWLTY